MKWLKQFFEEDNGKPSSMRLYSMAALVVAIILSFQINTDYYNFL